MNTFSEFVEDKVPNKCTFGEPWANMRKRGDILNPKNVDFITYDTLSPANYNPRFEKVRRFTGAYTCRPKYKRFDELVHERKPGPGPQVYSIEEKLVKQTRFTNPLVGGHGLKNGLIIDKNPGPG